MSGTSHRSRQDHIGDSALAVLAARGARGLTHRAVDARADLPAGSTSYYARSRSALLELALTRAAALESAEAGTDDLLDDTAGLPDDVDALAWMVADRLHRMITGDTTHVVARYELALEATRRSELRQTYGVLGGRYREVVGAALARAGSVDPGRHGDALLGWCDGVLFRSVVGGTAGDPPSRDDLRTTATELLTAMLGGPHQGGGAAG